MLYTPTLEAHLRGRIGAVSGSRFLQKEDARFVSGGCAMRITIAVEGWSPTLHDMIMHWDAEVDLSKGEDAGRRDLETAFDDRIAVQRERLAAGLETGNCIPHEGREGPDINHLRIDSALLRIMLAQDTEKGVRADLKERLEDLLVGCRSDGGEIIDGDLAMSVEGTALYPVASVGANVAFDGRRLYLPPDMPDALVAAMPGRRMGDVIAIHPDIDGRRIVSAGKIGTKRGDRETVVTTTPDLVTLGQAMAA